MQKINLNGLWDFVIDLDPKYHSADRPSYARVDWNRARWRKVLVPGVWNKYEERLDIYEGVCWFAREFEVYSFPKGSTALLRFGGVNYQCQVYLNGREVGMHEGGYTEFVMDVSSAIQPGKNFLAVRVDNRATTIKLPPCLGYFNYGGIHRDVTLEIYSAPYFEGVFVRGEPTTQGGRLWVQGRLGLSFNGLRVRVLCESSKVVQEIGGTEEFHIDLDVPNITPWCPKRPALYPVCIQLLDGSDLLHEVVYDIGFRRIEIEGRKILLNGEPVFLKGLCYVYDSPVYGVTLKSEQFLEDLALIKETGANVIRSHFPFSRFFYEACDRLGIMIWIEPPIYCINPPKEAKGTVFSDVRYLALAKTMLTEMILQARNHPSVIIYGVGNECNTENTEAGPFFQTLCEHVRNLDPTRPVSYASLYGAVGPLVDMVDVIGINEYWGWYDRIFACSEKTTNPKEIDLTALENKLKDLARVTAKPLLLTEFGADSIPGYRSSSCELWSEDYHARLLEETFALLKKHPEVSGAFPFCFSDYRDPSKWVNAYWDYMNYKGMVSYERRPKAAFHALKKIYQRL